MMATPATTRPYRTERTLIRTLRVAYPAGRDHQIRGYLPPGYDEKTFSHFPVVYMQDGQNLRQCGPPRRRCTISNGGSHMTMKTGRVRLHLRIGAVVALAMLLGATSPGLTLADDSAAPAKVKLVGYVISNDGQSLVVRDVAGKTTSVILTDETIVKAKNPGLGLILKGKKAANEALVAGLEVEVEGVSGADGSVVASKIQFEKKDMKMAQAIQAGVTPVEKQVSETDARIGDITNLDTRQEVTVNFPVNSTTLTPESKLALDGLASTAKGIQGYVIEVRGFADSTGNAEQNLALSKRRAEAVVSYLQVEHDIPIRRIVTPAGYGSTHAVSDNTTDAGRASNRRVEVKLLVSKGLQQK